jgi:hypothetical protein
MNEGVNEMLQVNDTVVLTGKTRHGKNRIQQHGKLWFVQEVRGGKIHLRSEHKTDGPMHNKDFDGRWIELQNDPNFEWVKGV